MAAPTRLAPLLAAALLLSLAPIRPAAAEPSFADGAAPLAAAIEEPLGRGCVDRSATAVRIVTLETGEPVYEHNADRSLLPASVLKLLTTATALHTLGPEYRFRTTLLTTGGRHGGVIGGDLVVKGGGDPKLVPEEIWRIARELARRGIRRIDGGLVVDDTFFDRTYNAPGWEASRSSRAYDAKFGALSASFNAVAVHVYPDPGGTGPLVVGTDPALPGQIAVVNRGTTVAGGRREVMIGEGRGEAFLTVVVEGSMAPGDPPKVRYVSVPDPPKFFGLVLRELLAREGITVGGSVRVAAAPADAQPLFVHESLPLVDILRQLNRHSNNFLAEQTAKTMAAEATGRPGSHQAAFDLMRRFLGELGIDTSQLALGDASGLSRDDRVTARIMTDLVSSMYRRADLWPEFAGSFAVMGMEGSMDRRLAGSPARGFVRAKTGSLTGVSNLVGYLTGQRGGRYAFAILQNDNRCGHDRADTVEDRIVDALYRLGAGR